MYENIWQCMTMYKYEWLCMTMYKYEWLCMTMYEKERERAIFKSFFILLQFIKNFQTIYTFSYDSNVLKVFILLNKPQHCLPLFTFVYLCLPLFNWRIYAQILCLIFFQLCTIQFIVSNWEGLNNLSPLRLLLNLTNRTEPRNPHYRILKPNLLNCKARSIELWKKLYKAHT